MKKKIFALLASLVLILAVCTGCTESDRATWNVQKEADNFNVTRHLIVMNARTDTVMMDLVGNFSLSNNSTNELQVTIEDEDGNYHINYIYLNDDTLYVVEDLSGSDVSPYHYELNILPEMLPVFDFTHSK